MKIFNFHILKQKTLDELCERLAEDRKNACKEAAKAARVIPNKMISKLLWQIYGKRRESLMEAYKKSQMRAF